MTVIEAIESIFEPLRDMEKQIMKAADQAAAHPEDERLLHRLDSLQQEYDRKGGYTYKSEMNGILTSMAFGPEYHDKKIKSLSGGERTDWPLLLCCWKNRICSFLTNRPTIWI